LHRIGLTDLADSDTFSAAELRRLMQAHLRAITFENLDVQAGKVVSLLPEDIVSKIVGSDGCARRGGYCYEQNGLFAMALTALGIPYYFVACRPMFYPMLRPKTHMALIVTVQQQAYLCDLGFGSYGMRAPIALAEVNLPQQQEFDQFRLAMPVPGEYVLQAWVNEQWSNQFGFDLHPAQWIDFLPANYLNSTHPDTIFVQKRLLIRQTAEGRYLLLGNELKTTRAGLTTVTEVADPQLPGLLADVFGLDPAALAKAAV